MITSQFCVTAGGRVDGAPKETILLSAASQLCGQTAARAGDMSCSGLIGGGLTVTNIDGNVTVPDGTSCTLSFVNVTGNVQVGRGTTLIVSAYTEPSEIGGDIEAKDCNSVLLQGNVTVGPEYQLLQRHGVGPKRGSFSLPTPTSGSYA
jgi:hypothetical protein